MAKTEHATLRLALGLEGIPNRLSKLRMLIVALENGEAERSSRIYRRIRAALIAISKMPNLSDDEIAMAARLRLRLDGCDEQKLKTRADKEQRMAELRSRMKMSGSPTTPQPTTESASDRLQRLLDMAESKNKETPTC